MDTKEIDYQLNIQNTYVEILLECLSQINLVIQSAENIDNPNDVLELLRESKDNLDSIRSNINNLKELKNYLPLSEDSNLDADKIEHYTHLSNTYEDAIWSSTTKLNQFLLKYIKSSSFVIGPLSARKSTQDEFASSENILETSSYSSSLKQAGNNSYENYKNNNVLLISERQQKVFLPYKVSDLIRILEKNNSYQSLQEIIDKKYTVSLEKYKNPFISRFRETYTLMRKREKASIADSLDLALSLTFNASLNPAIITACKNLEQLETYLDCLELNETSKFEFFEIKFEYLPSK